MHVSALWRWGFGGVEALEPLGVMRRRVGALWGWGVEALGIEMYGF
jgi:hypothetical protein